jgi:hypothetical protein
MADSPARILALQAGAKAWTESEADYFSRLCAWPKKSDPNFYSLKTCQQSGQEDSIPLAGNWPRQGMIVDGVLYPLLKSAQITRENGGFCWPTPVANQFGRKLKDGKNISAKGVTYGLTLQQAINLWPTPLAQDGRGDMSPANARRKAPGLAYTVQMQEGGGKLNPVWVEWLMGYPSGWTELKDWAMQWFRDKRGRRSKSSPELSLK